MTFRPHLEAVRWVLAPKGDSPKRAQQNPGGPLSVPPHQASHWLPSSQAAPGGSQPKPAEVLSAARSLIKLGRLAPRNFSGLLGWEPSIYLLLVAGGGFCERLWSPEYLKVMNPPLRIR